MLHNNITKRLISAMPRFRLQYASNFHLHLHEKPLFPLFVKPAAKYLALLGNIGTPEHPHFANFFTWAASRWDTIVYSPHPTDTTSDAYEYTRHLQNVHVLTKSHPFYLFEREKIALWSPFEDDRPYRKIFVLAYDSIGQRAFLEDKGCIYSHGINGQLGSNKYVNMRGDKESPTEGFTTTSCLFAY